MKVANFLFPLFGALLSFSAFAGEHDRSYWEQIVTKIRPGMKRSEAEKLLPRALMEDGGWNHLSVFYPLEGNNLAIQIVYFHIPRRGRPRNADLPEDIVMEIPKLYDPRPEGVRAATQSKP